MVTLRTLHITLVIASGSLFAMRGIALLAGARWARLLPVRVASVVLDTALLAAGVALAWTLRLNPLAVPWLGTKLALLVLYVLLGTAAFRRAGSAGAGLAWFVAALACFGFMVTVARARHPLGAFAGLWP